MNSLKNIPFSRALLYLLLLGLLPFVFALFLFVSQKNEIEELQNSIELIQHQAFIKEKKQALNLAVGRHYREADHFYIDKHLETLTFLEPEIDQLQKIVQDQNFAGDDRIKKRLEFLTGQANSLVFTEGTVHSFPYFQETSETLTHPVEVDSVDIQKILALIEGVKIGDFKPGPYSPQLLVTEFKLEKKKVNHKNEVYLLNLKLIKREFL